jgi:uncharacterized membrane protein YsdA (DUF1294 family)
MEMLTVADRLGNIGVYAAELFRHSVNSWEFRFFLAHI